MQIGGGFLIKNRRTWSMTWRLALVLAGGAIALEVLRLIDRVIAAVYPGAHRTAEEERRT